MLLINDGADQPLVPYLRESIPYNDSFKFLPLGVKL